MSRLKKFDEIKQCVNLYYNIDCMKVCRDRIYVEARMVLYRILRDLKYSYTEIANLVGKNHATIINGLHKFDAYTKYDPDLLTAYHDIRDNYFVSNEENPIFFMSNEGLINLVISLEKQIKILNLMNTELNSKLHNYKVKYSGIIDVLESTPKTKSVEVRQYIEGEVKNVLSRVRNV